MNETIKEQIKTHLSEMCRTIELSLKTPDSTKVLTQSMQDYLAALVNTNNITSYSTLSIAIDDRDRVTISTSILFPGEDEETLYTFMVMQ